MDQRLAGRRKAIEHERSLFEANPADGAIDPVLQDSWLRCAPALSPHQLAAPFDDSTAAELWDASLIRRASPDLLVQLQEVADDGDLVAAVTDESGRILWSHGGRTMRNRAESVNFTVGGQWDEGSAGTNAVGMALITSRPSIVFSAEHWCDGVRDWVCYSAPVHDPSGRPIGVVDLSSTWDRTNPLGLPTVTAMARLVEEQLRALLRAGRNGRRPAARPRAEDWHRPLLVEQTPLLEISVLGSGAVRLGGQPVLLTPRQLELLTVLACAGGLTLDELHTHLHGDRPVSLTTTKVEVSRLRGALGVGVVGSRPYRLRVPVAVDLLQLVDRLERGDLSGALALYRGQLLPRSDAPFLVERRHHCDVALRTAVLEMGTPADLLAFASVHPYDVAVMERALERSPAGDPLRASAAARLAVALDEPSPI